MRSACGSVCAERVEVQLRDLLLGYGRYSDGIPSVGLLGWDACGLVSGRRFQLETEFSGCSHSDAVTVLSRSSSWLVSSCSSSRARRGERHASKSAIGAPVSGWPLSDWYSDALELLAEWVVFAVPIIPLAAGSQASPCGLAGSLGTVWRSA